MCQRFLNESYINKLNSYVEGKLSKFITGFRKAHRTQHSLTTMVEKWKSVLDKRDMFAVYLWISQKPLIQLLTISCWQN